MEKVLIFCTYFAYGESSHSERLFRWIKALGWIPESSTVLIVDDGSRCVPDWQHQVIYEEKTPRVEDIQEKNLIFYRFANRMSRANSRYYFPGWYRSFGFALRYAVIKGFDRVIHIESDAAIISRRAQELVKSISSGWFAFPLEGGPETGIQVISGKESIFRAFINFSDSYFQYADRYHETLIPFDGILDQLSGGRHVAPDLFIPGGADFAMQIRSCRESSYYSWLGGNGINLVREHVSTIYPRDLAGGLGWSDVEDYGKGEFVWMEGNTSHIRFDKNLIGVGEKGFVLIYFRDVISRDDLPVIFSVFSAGERIYSCDIRLAEGIIGFDITHQNIIEDIIISKPYSVSIFSSCNGFDCSKSEIYDRRVLSICVDKVEVYKVIQS
jgi:hypothetical protein